MSSSLEPGNVTLHRERDFTDVFKDLETRCLSWIIWACSKSPFDSLKAESLSWPSSQGAASSPTEAGLEDRRGHEPAPMAQWFSTAFSPGYDPRDLGSSPHRAPHRELAFPSACVSVSHE